MPTPEGRVKTAVKKVLKEYDNKVWVYMPVSTGYGRKTVDFIICANGWFMAIETKAGNEVPTKLQELCLQQIAEAGGSTFVVQEHNLEAHLEDLRLILDSFIDRTLIIR